MSDQKELLKTLYYEADWLRLTGELLPNLELQFKMLPRVVLNQPVTAETQIDTEKFAVKYVIKAKGKLPKNVATRMEKLLEHTQSLLGKGFTVSVELNKKQYQLKEAHVKSILTTRKASEPKS